MLHVVDGRPLPEAPDVPAEVGARRRRSTRITPSSRRWRARGTRSCTCWRRPTTPSTPSSRPGTPSASRSWWSAATASGTATSTPTTSAPPSRPGSTPAGPTRSGSPTCPSRCRRRAGSARAWRPTAPPRWRRRWSRSASATWSRTPCGSLGAQRVVAGGQTMNPSTADLLEAIDAVAADEVVVLPNNKNVVPVAEQAAKLASRPARVVPTKGLVEGLAALLVYDPDADGATNAEAMAEAAGQVVSGQITHAVRDAGEIAEGDWLGLAGDEIVVVRRDLAGVRRRPAGHAGRRPPRAGHGDRGRDGHGGGHRAGAGVAGVGPAQGRGRRPVLAAAALRLPVQHRVGARPHAGGRRLAQLAAIPVSELKGVGAVKAEALAKMEINTVLDLLTHYPRRYVDRTRQADIADLRVGDEAVVLATVKKVQSRRTRQRRAIVEVDVFDGTSYLHCVFFNQPWRSKQLNVGTQAIFFGKLERYRGRRQMTNPAGRPGGRPHRQDRPGLPPVGEGRARLLGAGGLHRGGAGPGRALRRPAARALAGRAEAGRPADGLHVDPQPRVDGGGPRGPPPARAGRAAAHAGGPGPAQAGGGAGVQGDPPRGRRRPRAPRSTPGCPSR